MDPTSDTQRDVRQAIADALRNNLDIADESVAELAGDIASILADEVELPNAADDLLIRSGDAPEALADLQSGLAAAAGALPSSYRDRLPGLMAAVSRAAERASPTAVPPPTDGIDAPLMQQLINAIPDPIFIKDDDHRWVLLNDAYCEFMGYNREALIGKSDFDFFPETEAREFWKRDNTVFSRGTTDINREDFTDSEGNRYVIRTCKTGIVDSDGNRYILGLIRDITRQQRLEERLDVARQMVSLGTLAGGIAHEINNPLTYVLTNLDYLLETLGSSEEPVEEQRDALEAAIRGSERVKSVIEGLSNFAELSDDDLQPLDLNSRLESTLCVAAPEIKRNARLVEDYNEVPTIDGNPQSLDQILLNLLANATDAIESSEPDDHEIRIASWTDDSGWAVIEVSDSGAGIPPNIQDQIFDPFFTTKSTDDGTGLGLSICESLVDGMNGTIEVESTPGQGSTFELKFPPSSHAIDR